MSLRARLLVGLGAVALVLVVAAVAVTREAESYLLDQVDARLSTTHRLGGQDDRVVGPYYFGELAPGDDTVQIVAGPDMGEGSGALPDIDAAEARAAAGPGADHYFTVGSSGGAGPRYRVWATIEDHSDRGQGDGGGPGDGGAQGDGQHVTVVAASLADADAAVSRLVGVEVAATGVVLVLLGLVTFWVLRLGVRPLKEMTRAATVIRLHHGGVR